MINMSFITSKQVSAYFVLSQHVILLCHSLGMTQGVRTFHREYFYSWFQSSPSCNSRHKDCSSFCPHNASLNCPFRFLRIPFQENQRTYSRADNSCCRLWPSSLTSFTVEWKRVAKPHNDGAQLNWIGLGLTRLSKKLISLHLYSEWECRNSCKGKGNGWKKEKHEVGQGKWEDLWKLRRGKAWMRINEIEREGRDKRISAWIGKGRDLQEQCFVLGFLQMGWQWCSKDRRDKIRDFGWDTYVGRIFKRLQSWC